MAGNDELVSRMVLVSIIIDIERIGDFTKNIVEIAQNHPQRLHAGEFEDDLYKIENAVADSLNRTIDCFKNSNETAAVKLLKEYKWLPKACNKKIGSLIRDEDVSLTSGGAVALTIYVRGLKKIFAHSSNITTSIVNPFDRIGFQLKKRSIRLYIVSKVFNYD